ncbi:MAG: alpha/beta fold hydrolase [Brevinematales bacterium]|jgi:carboxylesterase
MKYFNNIFSIAIVLAGLLYLINVTPLLYFEPSAYNRAAEPPLFDERAKDEFYANKNSSKLIILIHGFPSSPFAWKRIGAQLSNSYNVLIPRMYGFGTTPGFFKNTYYSQWYSSIKDIYTRYRKDYSDVTVCGISFGGSVTLRLAEDFGNSSNMAMKRIVVISAPVFLNNLRIGLLYDPRLYLVRSITWFEDEMPSNGKDSDSFDKDGGIDIGFKEVFPKQIYSMLMGLRTTRLNLSKVAVPILLMQAQGDRVVPFENLDYIYDHVSSKEKSKYVFRLDNWNDSRHLLTVYNSTYGTVYSNIINFMSK